MRATAVAIVGVSAVGCGAIFGAGSTSVLPDSGAPPLEAAAGSGSSDGGSSSTIASPEVAWLAPMNAARAVVGEAPLHWDPLAAQVALTYAGQCDYAHNPNASAEYKALGGTSGLGENIAGGVPTQTVSSAVNGWIAEQTSYDHATNACTGGKDCGHYTQIVWSTTSGVGCAQVSCTTGSPLPMYGGGHWDFEVCDFSPPGNIIGQLPY
jgi:pathogenesis-related protein 1